MKKILLLFFIIIIFVFCLYKMINYQINYNKKTEYCGKVTEVYITPSGYKVYPEHRVVFYCKKLGKKINVKVSENSWSNAIVGETICFDLKKHQIE